ncbi:MAG TPA: family 20 glycosylhydrolase [Bacteroidales bacterium]|nr:family 20 glycosylhydrolase [Bacteroidales bacterium]
MKKDLKLLVVFLIIALQTAAQLPLIPYPAHVSIKDGSFQFSNKTKLLYDSPLLASMADAAAIKWSAASTLQIESLEHRNGTIEQSVLLSLNQPFDDELGMEGYQLVILNANVVLSANTPAGILYGLQTIGQLLDAATDAKISCATIVDFPRFSYRGMHLDVSRHFMPVSLIYTLLDELEQHKMNVFHWHLVDDQGWRIEIKKYPKLTEVGAWREDRSDLHWNDRPLSKKDALKNIGGFYTQDEIRAVVAYASQKNITVIPEIEMPAHVMSVLAAYPELSCTGENLGVPPGGVWPITHIYCAGKEETFVFLENVLTEVMDLFPSRYIHIGGDEADKTNWKKCTHCQKRMKDEGLKDEHELQSYFIHRIEKYLNAHGRNIIGWDEILEGGLAPNATVMSWRGEEGGIAAAKMGHNVIMTPGSHCYFDHYQGDASIEPLAIGGYTPLSKVYSYEPVPKELTAEESRFVLGAQANHWTEYMPVDTHVEYMAFPRLAALSEVLWSPKESRNWDSFARRLPFQFVRYAKRGINASKSAYQVQINAAGASGAQGLDVSLSTEIPGTEIRYTSDGTEPGANDKIYNKALFINNTTTIKAAGFSNGKQLGAATSRLFTIHKAFGKALKLSNQPGEQYKANGEASLVDGVTGTVNHNDKNWLGFYGKDLEAIIDLGKTETLHNVWIETLHNSSAWIFAPREVTVSFSEDGKKYSEAAPLNIAPCDQSRNRQTIAAQASVNAAARYVKVIAKNHGQLPENHPGAGKDSWLFISEIVVE